MSTSGKWALDAITAACLSYFTDVFTMMPERVVTATPIILGSGGQLGNTEPSIGVLLADPYPTQDSPCSTGSPRACNPLGAKQGRALCCPTKIDSRDHRRALDEHGESTAMLFGSLTVAALSK